jgi:hypothetical protein
MTLGLFKKFLALCGYPQVARVAIVPGCSGIRQTVTGTTNEVVLDQVTIPGGAMGTNGQLRISGLWSFSNNVNTKTLRIKIGGTVFEQIVAPGNLILPFEFRIANRGVANSQVSIPLGMTSFYTPQSSVALVMAVDTSVDQVLQFTGQLTVGTDTASIESWLVEILPG